MDHEMPKDDHAADTIAVTKKSWMKPTAVTVETRCAENNPGPGSDANSCHS
jgi:hypothetical protein